MHKYGKQNVIAGEMKIYAGGQQPNQRTTVGSNVLETSFMLKADPMGQPVVNQLHKSPFTKL